MATSHQRSRLATLVLLTILATAAASSRPDTRASSEATLEARGANASFGAIRVSERDASCPDAGAESRSGCDDPIADGTPFDLWELARSWTPGFCASGGKRTCAKKECAPDAMVPALTLHGLWPSFSTPVAARQTRASFLTRLSNAFRTKTEKSVSGPKTAACPRGCAPRRSRRPGGTTRRCCPGARRTGGWRPPGSPTRWARTSGRSTGRALRGRTAPGQSEGLTRRRTTAPPSTSPSLRGRPTRSPTPPEAPSRYAICRRCSAERSASRSDAPSPASWCRW